MKITPNTSLFTAISTFPDAGQVRDGLADRRKLKNTGAEGAAIQGGEGREAVRREALKKAALLQTQNAAKTASPQSTAEEAPSVHTTGSVRREAPFAEVKPKFARLGQFIDIKV